MALAKRVQNSESVRRASARKPSRRAAAVKPAPRATLSPARALSARRKFLQAFPGGFRDETYLDWERAYKWRAHLEWERQLDLSTFRALLRSKRYGEIASRAIRIESRTNLLFSFEKMALRDAIRGRRGAEIFAKALFELLHGRSSLSGRSEKWIGAIARLPRRQKRVLTWPLVTVFGFLAQPQTHFFFKPTVTREAARRYGQELCYASGPSWPQYQELNFVGAVRRDLRNLKPRDMIDLQSFLWVQGSDEYPD